MQPVLTRSHVDDRIGRGRCLVFLAAHDDLLVAKPAVNQPLGAEQFGGLTRSGQPLGPMSRCSGRMPTMVPARPPGAFFNRFIGGEPMKLATKVDAGR